MSSNHTIQQIIDIIDEFAPPALQEPWDNSGLQLGDPTTKATAALLTLDVTLESVDQAIATGANLIIAHHPLIFDPIRSITPNTTIGQIVLKAAANNIAIYCSHTPMDAAPEGLNNWIAQQLHLQNIQPLQPNGLGREGTLPQSMSTTEFATLLKKIFRLTLIRTNATPADRISHVAICSGSGYSLINQVRQTQADTFICGDLKYHNFQEALPLKLFDIGHFESENQFISIIKSLFSEKIPNFVFHTLNSNFTTIL